jgi:hypothetical protein
MNYSDRNRSGSRRSGGGSRTLNWLIPLAAFVLAMAAAFAIERLNEYTDERIRAEVLLAEIKEAADHQHLAGVEAIVEGDVSPATAEEIGELRREITEKLEELERLNVEEE